jgi:hypothetical protein
VLPPRCNPSSAIQNIVYLLRRVLVPHSSSNNKRQSSLLSRLRVIASLYIQTWSTTSSRRTMRDWSWPITHLSRRTMRDWSGPITHLVTPKIPRSLVRGEWLDEGVCLRKGSIFEIVRTPTRFEVLGVQFGALVWTSFSVALSASPLCIPYGNGSL